MQCSSCSQTRAYETCCCERREGGGGTKKEGGRRARSARVVCLPLVSAASSELSWSGSSKKNDPLYEIEYRDPVSDRREDAIAIGREENVPLPVDGSNQVGELEQKQDKVSSGLGDHDDVRASVPTWKLLFILAEWEVEARGKERAR